jgi:putative N6-adenine-specific DNA methylase
LKPFTLIATAAFGLEAVVARELQQLGYTDTKTFNGYVEFTGDEADIARANLWLRTADRVEIKVGQFRATTFEELFEQTKALPWADLMPKDAHFPVEGRSVKSQLSSEPACQSIVKKAIVESLKKKYPIETFPETGPRYDIEVSLLKDEVTLTLDTSGAGLHKRGYRKLTAQAPIKETLAAALVLLSRWEPHRVFADPLCGSGTIAIEAAMIGRNIAPGLRRKFVSEQWDWIPATVWKRLRDEAVAMERTDKEVRVFASDIDPEVLSLAEYHARKAGVGPFVHITQKDIADFTNDDPYGCIVTNPPYGERLGERGQVEALYRTMGRVFHRLDRWSLFVITSHPRFEQLFGKPADKKRKLYNGRIQTNFYQYLGPLPRLRTETQENV